MYFDAGARAGLLGPLGPSDGPPPEAWRASIDADVADPRDRAMRVDFQTTSPTATW